MSKIVGFLLQLLFSLPVILVSLSVHEFSHGLVADKLGDHTARYAGRLTLNPMKHIDPIGFLALVFFHIGWAKPVMVDTRNFKKPKRDMALTALAGPVSNFVLAALFSFVLFLLYKIFPDNHAGAILSVLNGAQVSGIGFDLVSILTVYAFFFLTINVGLGVFNLIPVPPLDGSKILYAFLPNKIVYKIEPYERYFMIALIVLLWLGVLSGPINALVYDIASFLLRLALGGVG